MRLPRILSSKSVAVLVVCVGAGYGAFVGISSASSSGTSAAASGTYNLPANTAGVGGHPYPIAASNAAIAASALGRPVQGELSSIGATSAVPLASIGSGSNETDVYSVAGANGANCIEFTHGGGMIAEAPNCASDAYLRVSDIVNGSGDAETGTVTSMQVVAVVSTEADAVRVSFANGSTQDYKPDHNGIVTLQTSGQPVPVSVSAIDGAGTTLATVGV